MDDELTPIADFCDDAGLPFDDDTAELMAHYLDLLMHFDDTLGLIGPDDRETVVEELLVDSLVAAAARAPKGPILDVGTGAGLPGIPIKIVFDDMPLTLVEPRGRRSTFLKIASHRLELDQVELFEDRIEEYDGAGFDYVVSKAFREPTEWLETALPYTAADGAVVCMGRSKDRDRLNDAAEQLDLQLVGDASIGAEGPDQRVCYAFERN